MVGGRHDRRTVLKGRSSRKRENRCSKFWVEQSRLNTPLALKVTVYPRHTSATSFCLKEDGAGGEGELPLNAFLGSFIQLTITEAALFPLPPTPFSVSVSVSLSLSFSRDYGKCKFEYKNCFKGHSIFLLKFDLRISLMPTWTSFKLRACVRWL